MDRNKFTTKSPLFQQLAASAEKMPVVSTSFFGIWRALLILVQATARVIGRYILTLATTTATSPPLCTPRPAADINDPHVDPWLEEFCREWPSASVQGEWYSPCLILLGDSMGGSADPNLQEYCFYEMIFRDQLYYQSCSTEIHGRSPLACSTMAVTPPHLITPRQVANISDPQADPNSEARCYDWSLMKDTYYLRCIEKYMEGSLPPDLAIQKLCSEAASSINEDYSQYCLGDIPEQSSRERSTTMAVPSDLVSRQWQILTIHTSIQRLKRGVTNGH